MEIPVYNAKIAKAKDAEGRTVGVTISCLYTEEQIQKLPLMVRLSAERVFKRESESHDTMLCSDNVFLSEEKE